MAGNPSSIYHTPFRFVGEPSWSKQNTFSTSSLHFFFFLKKKSQSMLCCYMQKPKQGHEHCLRIQKWILSHFTAADKLIKVAHSQQDLYLHKQHPVDFQSITIIAASSICLFIGNREHRPEMLDLLFFFISAHFNFLLQVNGQVPLLAAEDTVYCQDEKLMFPCYRLYIQSRRKNMVQDC